MDGQRRAAASEKQRCIEKANATSGRTSDKSAGGQQRWSRTRARIDRSDAQSAMVGRVDMAAMQRSRGRWRWDHEMAPVMSRCKRWPGPRSPGTSLVVRIEKGLFWPQRRSLTVQTHSSTKTFNLGWKFIYQMEPVYVSSPISNHQYSIINDIHNRLHQYPHFKNDCFNHCDDGYSGLLVDVADRSDHITHHRRNPI